MLQLFRTLRRDEGGAALVEFALIAPTLCLMLIGLFDISYNMYSNTMLTGAVQDAARDSTIEGASATAVDNAVRDAVQDIAPDANLTFSRTAYSEFTSVSRPEDYTDLNGNGTCDAGEPFEDINNNGTWDQDQGTTGQGGARDAVLYEVTVEYPRAFPLAAFIGISPNYRTTTTTVLRNQPFAASEKRDAVGNCA
ncbi:MAG: TadE/TadG family type IV pilus assembly protein [Altererythrobacter sp.]